MLLNNIDKKVSLPQGWRDDVKDAVERYRRNFERKKTRGLFRSPEEFEQSQAELRQIEVWARILLSRENK